MGPGDVKVDQQCICALNRDLDGSDDEDPSENGGSTDEDIRELRSRQEASAGPLGHWH